MASSGGNPLTVQYLTGKKIKIYEDNIIYSKAIRCKNWSLAQNKDGSIRIDSWSDDGKKHDIYVAGRRYINNDNKTIYLANKNSVYSCSWSDKYSNYHYKVQEQDEVIRLISALKPMKHEDYTQFL